MCNSVYESIPVYFGIFILHSNILSKSISLQMVISVINLRELHPLHLHPAESLAILCTGTYPFGVQIVMFHVTKPGFVVGLEGRSFIKMITSLIASSSCLSQTHNAHVIFKHHQFLKTCIRNTEIFKITEQNEIKQMLHI